MKNARLLPLVVCAVAACKGSTVYKDNPDTLDKLGKLQAQIEEQKKLIAQLQDANSACTRNQGVPPEITYTLEPDLMHIKPGRGGPSIPGIDEATTSKQSQAFLDMVQKSRGAIQKCYEQALKKNSGLQARTVSLKLSAKFAASGDFSGSSFNPSLGDTFDACLRTVAGRWKMPAAPAAMTFQASLSLSPT